jgi:hypothetical protein
MLGACTDTGSPDVQFGNPLARNAAQEAARYADIPEAAPCSEAGDPARAEPRLANSGAWSAYGRRVEDDFWFRAMSDTNGYRRGSIYVRMQNSNGRSLELMVRAHGGEWIGRNFAGPGWEAASTQARAAIVRRTIVESAQRVAGTCGARLDSLDEEMETFDHAFADLDSPWR